VTIEDPAEIRAQYRRWQFRVLFLTISGYATAYLLRGNLSVAQPVMGNALYIDKDVLGLFLTLNGLLYGLSKFINGFLGDRANARAMMVTGIVVSAVLNIFFGLNSTAVALGLVWMMNGWFQGMAFPPCARLMTNWFSPKELATKMSIWNMSHQIGGGVILVLCGYLVQYDWRYCFFVPAGIALLYAYVLSRTLPDTPPSLGLPDIEGTASASGEQTGAEFRALVLKKVFMNPFIWVVSVSNFFVYIIRFVVFNWGPTILTEVKHLKIVHAAWMVAGFEWAGAIGALLAGWLTDRYFSGRAMRIALVYFVLAGTSLCLFWIIPTHSELVSAFFLCATGFFIYGPQSQVAIAAANLATKRYAATAVGLTSIFGYGSTLFSGWGLGWLVKHYSWDVGFKALMAVTVVGIVVFTMAWPAKADGYDDEPGLH